MTYNLLFAGVGGQGVVLASEVLALAAASEGYDVKQGEVHGAAQRGGAVMSHIRFGEHVHSPLNLRGRPTLWSRLRNWRRCATHYLKLGGVLIVNDHRIEPTLLNSAVQYPTDPIGFLKTKPFRVLVLNATETAGALGNDRVASLVMLGAVSKLLPIKRESWDRILQERIPAKYLELNRRAFSKGSEAVQ
jgi:indolepyruvate ferredoxin oxidoreductase beta subunit